MEGWLKHFSSHYFTLKTKICPSVVQNVLVFMYIKVQSINFPEPVNQWQIKVTRITRLKISINIGIKYISLLLWIPVRSQYLYHISTLQTIGMYYVFMLYLFWIQLECLDPLPSLELHCWLTKFSRDCFMWILVEGMNAWWQLILTAFWRILKKNKLDMYEFVKLMCALVWSHNFDDIYNRIDWRFQASIFSIINPLDGLKKWYTWNFKLLSL